MSNYLEEEKKNATFNISELSAFFYGSKERHQQIKKWEKLFDDDPIFDSSKDAYLPREELLKLSAKRALRTVEIFKKNKDLLAAHSPVHGEGGMWAPRLNNNHSGITDHYCLFIGTLLTQATPAQLREWLVKSLNLEMIGTYAQTELGHGTNVRGLETTATFNPLKDTFTINMPHITSMKWWPGALGLLATHAIVYARLIVGDKDYGFNAFMVQIRDENHKPMPGMEMGDIGPKLGSNALDSGYLYIKNVEIPRFNMLAKFQALDQNGNYTRAPKNLAKIGYATMMKTRVILITGAGLQLLHGLAIAIRYNAFRKQGFLNSKKGIEGGERCILDYQVQQYRLFPHIATCFALYFSGQQVLKMLEKFEKQVKAAGRDLSKIDASCLPELHATSSGMKSYGCEMCAAGLEEARKCCGGQGYALSSGIAQLLVDYTAQVTFEGDRIPMALQTARVLMGALAGKVDKSGTFAYLNVRWGGGTILKRTDDLPHLCKVFETIARTAVNEAGKKLWFTFKRLKSFDTAWNACHLTLMGASHAHTMCQFVVNFAEAVEKAGPNIRPVLQRLCRLFALTQLSQISVRYTKLSAGQASMVDQAIKTLLSELRPDAVALCESGDVSERYLMNSHISTADGKIYENLYAFAKNSPLNRPGFSEKIHKEILSQFLDKNYLSKGNQSRL